MASSYKPGSHTSPETAKVGTIAINGPSPGQVFVALNDGRAPTYAFLPTGTTSDGFPTALAPFLTGTGAVT